MGNIRLYGSTSGYTELAPPAVAPDGVLTLPTGTGTLATQASVGLVKIVDQSFTAASSVSVNNCFTSAYENYRLVINHSSSSGAAVDLFARLRLSGTDVTGNNYLRAGHYNTNTSAGTLYADSLNTLIIGSVASFVGINSTDIFQPNKTAPTGFTSLSFGVGSTATSGLYIVGCHTLSTAYDGITIYPSSGTITGTLRVYGYQN